MADPARNNFGADYSRFLGGPAQPGDPFPHPQNDAQRQANARARAARAGVNMGPGYLNPQSGEMQNPNADHWYSDPRVLGPAAIAAGTGLGLLMGPAAAGASGTLASSSLPASMTMNAIPPAIASQGVSAGLGGIGATVAGGAAGAGAAGAAGAAGSGAAGSAGQSLAQRAAAALSSGDGAGLAALLPFLTSIGRGGSGGGSGTDFGGMPQLQSLLNMTTERAQRTDPLHQMVTRLAESRMPTNMRGGR